MKTYKSLVVKKSQIHGELNRWARVGWKLVYIHQDKRGSSYLVVMERDDAAYVTKC